MPGSAQVTTDHQVIRKWVEDRDGKPASVKGTGGERDAGLIRINFPGYSGEKSLREISWEEFFDKFEEKPLAFLYQDTIHGEKSRFFKLVSRESSRKGKTDEEETGH